MERMSRVQFFPTRGFRALAARLGFPVVLLLAAPCLNRAQQLPSVAELLQQFETTTVSFRQFEVAKALVATKDASILPKLEPWLTRTDRHLRGNAAFIFASLGDSRGFDVITAILADRSDRPFAQGVSGIAGSTAPEYLSKAQIKADRYYAAHLLGDLKDPRAVPILVPLLKDSDVNWIVPWSLGQIGDKSAMEPLIATLSDKDASMRVLTIYALVELKAAEALPRLRQLLGDNERSRFDKLESVAEAARAAIAKLETLPQR
jgi:HEAT repeat protein